MDTRPYIAEAGSCWNLRPENVWDLCHPKLSADLRARHQPTCFQKNPVLLLGAFESKNCDNHTRVKTSLATTTTNMGDKLASVHHNLCRDVLCHKDNTPFAAFPLNCWGTFRTSLSNTFSLMWDFPETALSMHLARSVLRTFQGGWLEGTHQTSPELDSQ